MSQHGSSSWSGPPADDSENMHVASTDQSSDSGEDERKQHKTLNQLFIALLAIISDLKKVVNFVAGMMVEEEDSPIRFAIYEDDCPRFVCLVRSMFGIDAFPQPVRNPILTVHLIF